MFGVYLFAGQFNAGNRPLWYWAWLSPKAAAACPEVQTKHIYNLGSLGLAFTCSSPTSASRSTMLIWYANLPEESDLVQNTASRARGSLWPWRLPLLHFFIPFFLLNRVRGQEASGPPCGWPRFRFCWDISSNL